MSDKFLSLRKTVENLEQGLPEGQVLSEAQIALFTKLTRKEAEKRISEANPQTMAVLNASANRFVEAAKWVANARARAKQLDVAMQDDNLWRDQLSILLVEDDGIQRLESKNKNTILFLAILGFLFAYISSGILLQEDDVEVFLYRILGTLGVSMGAGVLIRLLLDRNYDIRLLNSTNPLGYPISVVKNEVRKLLMFDQDPNAAVKEQELDSLLSEAQEVFAKARTRIESEMANL